MVSISLVSGEPFCRPLCLCQTRTLPLRPKPRKANRLFTERLGCVSVGYLNSVLEAVHSLLRANFPVVIVPWDPGTQTRWP